MRLSNSERFLFNYFFNKLSELNTKLIIIHSLQALIYFKFYYLVVWTFLNIFSSFFNFFFTKNYAVIFLMSYIIWH